VARQTRSREPALTVTGPSEVAVLRAYDIRMGWREIRRKRNVVGKEGNVGEKSYGLFLEAAADYWTFHSTTFMILAFHMQ